MSNLQPLESNTATPLNNQAIESDRLAYAIADAADDKKAADIVLLKVDEVSYIADYFVIATGFSTPQLKAIADSVENKVAEKLNIEPIRIEGKSDARWILIDYGDVIVHLFLGEEREYYNLEAFWAHGSRIEYTNSPEK